MTTSITKATGDLIAALANLTRAQIKSKLDPCPPHDWIDNGDFCTKCGTYKDEVGEGHAPNA